MSLKQSDLLKLSNPHSILEALRVRPSAVKSIFGRSEQGHWEQVRQLAAKHRIPTTATDQGNGAWVEPREAQSTHRFFSSEPDAGPQIYLVLDCLHDPHNVGAIFRTAAFMGVKGIVLTEERSVSLTSAVYDVASGAMEHVPFAFAVNLARVMREAKDESGVWILGTSGLGETDKSLKMSDFKLDRSWAVVFGNEEKGIRRLTMDLCDQTLTIPRVGQPLEQAKNGNADLTSLNVSVAVGVVLSHLRFGTS